MDLAKLASTSNSLDGHKDRNNIVVIVVFVISKYFIHRKNMVAVSYTKAKDKDKNQD